MSKRRARKAGFAFLLLAIVSLLVAITISKEYIIAAFVCTLVGWAFAIIGGKLLFSKEQVEP